MTPGKQISSIHQLHKNLWWYSFGTLIVTLISLLTQDIMWLVAGSMIGFIFWVSRYFIDHKDFSFPYGPANAVTLLRVCLLVMTTMMSPGITLFEAGVLYSIICLGDILDGYVARKFNMSTLIGEYLDKETDALFVLMSTAVLYFKGFAGIWVMALGLSRYIYYIGMYFFMNSDQKETKDLLAKYIAIFLFVSILACYLYPGMLSKTLLILSTLFILISFGRMALIELSFLNKKT